MLSTWFLTASSFAPPATITSFADVRLLMNRTMKWIIEESEETVDVPHLRLFCAERSAKTSENCLSFSRADHLSHCLVHLRISAAQGLDHPDMGGGFCGASLFLLDLQLQLPDPLHFLIPGAKVKRWVEKDRSEKDQSEKDWSQNNDESIERRMVKESLELTSLTFGSMSQEILADRHNRSLITLLVQ